MLKYSSISSFLFEFWKCLCWQFLLYCMYLVQAPSSPCNSHLSRFFFRMKALKSSRKFSLLKFFKYCDSDHAFSRFRTLEKRAAAKSYEKLACFQENSSKITSLFYNSERNLLVDIVVWTSRWVLIVKLVDRFLKRLVLKILWEIQIRSHLTISSGSCPYKISSDIFTAL